MPVATTALSPAMTAWQAALASQPNATNEQQLAFAQLLKLGLPTQRNDDWKYTDLRRLATKRFSLPSSASILTPDGESILLPLTASRRIVFVDGVLVTAQPAEATSIGSNNRTFSLLNAALNPHTLRHTVASGADETIYAAFVWTQAANGLMSHPRLSIQLGSQSKATFIEHHIGLSTHENFTNSLLTVDVGEHAALEHTRIQDDAASHFNIASIRVNVQRGGQYCNHHYVMGAALARTDMHITLTGREASANLHGLMLAQNSQHLDVHTCVEHQSPNTRSSEDYRGIADHRGRVVFRGKVIVAKDAQQTDAKQSSRNLLLSAQAEIDTRPELEIYANDVKCAHGATVGQLDNTSLFYLRSRGIDAAEARALLTHAFAAEVIERIPQTVVREHVLSRLMTRMRSIEASS